MTDPHGADPEIVGRGNREGARLFRDWFERPDARGRERRPRRRYVFVMGSLAELLRVFDFPIVFPEINSLQTAVRHVAHEYLNEAEDYGYSPDICGYVKADVATQLRGGALPDGPHPASPRSRSPPTPATPTSSGREIWERMYEIPMFTLDVPGTRAAGGASPPGSADFENDRRYVAAQLRELITLLRAGDRQALRHRPAARGTSAHANAHEPRLEARARAQPQPPGAVQRAHRRHDLPRRRQRLPRHGRGRRVLPRPGRGDGVQGRARRSARSTDEQYRLLFVGVPCYPIFRRFNEMFTELGRRRSSTRPTCGSPRAARTSASSTTSSDPLESLAEGLLIGVRDAMDSMFFHDRSRCVEMIDDFARRRHRLPPDQELPHRVDRAGRQPPRAHGPGATFRACSSSRT